MGHLSELLREFRECQSLEERFELAERIVEHVITPLTQYIHSKGLGDGAEDVTQMTLLDLSRQLQDFRGATEREFWGWCYRIARNKIANWFREHARGPVVGLDPEVLWRAVESSRTIDPLSPADLAQLHEAMAMLRAASPECYDALVQRYIFGLSFEEIGMAEGRRSDAVRMQVNRCLEKARGYALRRS